MDNQVKKSERFRHIFQVLWAVITNSYLIGFVRGKIYQGKIKNICVPGMNCYSCPGAVAACPIGALQATIGSYEYKFAFYVAGFMILVGTFMGRFVCGWLCPFGLIQDLLNKIPLPSKLKIRTFKGDRQLRWLKYGILLVFVILLPLYITDMIGQGYPWFCKLICPVGTLEGGIPLVLLNDAMRATVGWLYTWKNVILIVTILVSILIYRPFCKYICPLGAIYSLFNPVSILRYRVDSEKCVNCGACAKACKMGCDPVKNANSLECIRCGKCKNICPTHAVEYCAVSKSLRKKIKHKEHKIDSGSGNVDYCSCSLLYDRFCSPKTARKLARAYLSSCLADQIYIQVALSSGRHCAEMCGNCRVNGVRRESRKRIQRYQRQRFF